MNLVAEITLDAVVLNGLGFTRGERLEVYERVVGSPTRSVMPGPPPPFGHRNNVIHFYDHLGLLLREHHATFLIDGIDVLLEPSRCYFATTSPYSGTLRVCGVDIKAGMTFSDFAKQSRFKFRHHLGHAWYLDEDSISIQFEVRDTTESRPSPKELIVEVAVGFCGAHRRPVQEV